MPRNSWRTAFASCKLECGIVWWPAPLFQRRQFVVARVGVHERARCILALRVLVALARCHAFPRVCTIACALVRASMCMCACFVRERAFHPVSVPTCVSSSVRECASVPVRHFDWSACFRSSLRRFLLRYAHYACRRLAARSTRSQVFSSTRQLGSRSRAETWRRRAPSCSGWAHTRLPSLRSWAALWTQKSITRSRRATEISISRARINLCPWAQVSARQVRVTTGRAAVTLEGSELCPTLQRSGGQACASLGGLAPGVGSISLTFAPVNGSWSLALFASQRQLMRVHAALLWISQAILATCWPNGPQIVARIGRAQAAEALPAHEKQMGCASCGPAPVSML